MILINNSLPKSGSTLMCNYQEDLLAMSGLRSGQEVVRNRFQGRYVDLLGTKEIWRLCMICMGHGNAVVKTHCGPTQAIGVTQRLSLSKATYCYRDPRDVILSAIDHGKRSRNNLDTSKAFIDFVTVMDSIPMVRAMLETFYLWRSMPNTLLIRYEDLMMDPVKQLRGMVDFLEWPVTDADLENLVMKHNKNKENSWNFNKGTIERWKTEMSSAEISACTKEFYPFLQEMRYEI